MCLCFFEFILLLIFMIISTINVDFTFKILFISYINCRTNKNKANKRMN